MARRNILAKHKLHEFEEYLASIGIKTESPKGDFEVLRFKIKGSPMGIIYNGKSPEHYSVNEAAKPYVMSFIKRSR